MSGVLELPAADLTPPDDLVSQVKRRAGQLQMLPAVATEALEIAKDPECSIAEFTAVVERDAKLATDILKIANSALYSPSQPIINLHRAVVRLGFRECQNLILTASLASLMNRMSMEQEWIRGVLWRHSFNTALLAVHINRTFNLGFHGEEFTSGLMHDFGRTLLAVALPERFSEIDPLEFDESPDILQYETSIIGTDHCRLGAWFAKQNQLPEPIPEVLLMHHQPERAEMGLRLTALIAVADHMANHLQRFEESAGYDPESNTALAVLADSTTMRFDSMFIELCPTLMQEAQRDAESMMQV